MEEQPAAEPMTVREAGRRGGERVKAKYGADYFEQLGRRGGESTKKKYGPEHFESIGRKGGVAPHRERE